MLRVYDNNNRISFLIDTGSTVSTVQATSRDTSRNPNSKVLYSATANEIQTYGEKVLDISFGSDCNYTWCFTKTDLKFSVIGIDFLTAHKLIVDSYNRCLIDKNRNCVISLFPAHSIPSKNLLHSSTKKRVSPSFE